MASRKGTNIYISNHFMVVRICINVFVLYGLEVLSVELFVHRRTT